MRTHEEAGTRPLEMDASLFGRPRRGDDCSITNGDATIADQLAEMGPVDSMVWELADLKERGILSDEEFAAQKAKISEADGGQPASSARYLTLPFQGESSPSGGSRVRGWSA